jgi:hypothetical protein
VTSETQTGIQQYFGVDGPFAEACDLYRSKQYPIEITCEGTQRGADERIAYSLGYCFAEILERRKMPISPEDLQRIARNKISLSDPQTFVDGFHRHQSLLVTTGHESRVTENGT